MTGHQKALGTVIRKIYEVQLVLPLVAPFGRAHVPRMDAHKPRAVKRFACVLWQPSALFCLLSVTTWYDFLLFCAFNLAQNPKAKSALISILFPNYGHIHNTIHSPTN